MGNIENKDNKKIIKLIFFLLFILFIWYIFTKINVKKQNCKNFEKNGYYYQDDNNIKEFDEDDPYFSTDISINNRLINYDYKLRDFYFKTAYNCFCSGNFKNDYVDKCAFENCVNNGVLAYHMQIFSLNNEPIIASNVSNTNFYKESYNHITLEDVVGLFKTELENNTFQNNPIFLNLKIHYGDANNNADSKKAFYNKIFQKLQDLEYNNYKFNIRYIIDNNPDADINNRNKIIHKIPMKSTNNKIFLFVTLNNETNLDNIKESFLDQIVDLYEEPSSGGIKILESNEILNNDTYDVNKTLVKKYLTFCIPKSNTIRNDNYDSTNAIKYGIQFIAMNFQEKDNNLDKYNHFFDNSEEDNRPYRKKTDSIIEFSLF